MHPSSFPVFGYHLLVWRRCCKEKYLSGDLGSETPLGLNWICQAPSLSQWKCSHALQSSVQEEVQIPSCCIQFFHLQDVSVSKSHHCTSAQKKIQEQPRRLTHWLSAASPTQNCLRLQPEPGRCKLKCSEASQTVKRIHTSFGTEIIFVNSNFCYSPIQWEIDYFPLFSEKILFLLTCWDTPSRAKELAQEHACFPRQQDDFSAPWQALYQIRGLLWFCSLPHHHHL